MKQIVRVQLEGEEFRVVEEPLFPPANWISWSTYRPDLLGYREKRESEQVAIVECETHPNTKRFASKNYSSLWFQPTLLKVGSIRRILAVPAGKLGSLDLRLRKSWEIWVIGQERPLERMTMI
ncbi:MAG: hypothetical protein LYZ70_06570 [Nitrososphaerales archaeon]|nr:hypothetical protein [Nitrososphaerales archaeon]